MQPVRRVLVAAAAATLGILAIAAAPGTASAGPGKPTAAVSMGDSFISGEGAGDYEPGTDQPGNFCHRSTNSEIHEITINVAAQVNLACSGAVTANISAGGTPQNGEQPEADHLRQVAQDYDVKLVVLTIGANDVGFTPLVLDCIKGYFLIGPRCQDAWAQKFPAALAATEPKVESNLADIRAAMRADGYADSDYQLVLQSYSSPVTEDNRYGLTKLFEGCPIRDDDAAWARSSVVPGFSSMLGQAATAAGARYLDLGPALRGREVCANGIPHSQEWANGVKIDLAEIRNGLGENIVRQSFHPDALGHAQFGRCLSAFAQLTAAAAQCVRGSDGNLAPVAESVAAATRSVPMRILPRQAEPAPPATDRRRSAASAGR